MFFRLTQFYFIFLNGEEDSFVSFAFLIVVCGISGCLGAERAVTILVLVWSFRQLAVAWEERVSVASVGSYI